jgi:hypothetical protein
MKPRLNPCQAAPEAMNALMALETYVQGCGLEPALIDPVKTRASQINSWNRGAIGFRAPHPTKSA